jgi:hypothetical protein
LEAHLLGCADCRAELAELERTRSLLRELRGVDDPPDVASAVLARVERGEADAPALERFRFRVGEWLGGAWAAPLATVAAGLVLLAFVPPLEIEVRVPGLAPSPVSPPPVAQAPRPAPAAPLASRRIAETVLPPSLDVPQRLPPASVDCWERPSFEACQEQRHALIDLALRDTPGFLAHFDAVPSTQRELWIGELSRFAAEAGSAPFVAERLRASDDPRAWQMATRFEPVPFEGR